MDNIDSECKPEDSLDQNYYLLVPSGMIPISCSSCGAKCFIRPPPVDDGGPLYMDFKRYCKAFKCSKCNDSS